MLSFNSLVIAVGAVEDTERQMLGDGRETISLRGRNSFLVPFSLGDFALGNPFTQDFHPGRSYLLGRFS
jgi:hypothetical protein